MKTLEDDAIDRVTFTVHKLKAYIADLIHMCSVSKEQEQLIANSISVAPYFAKANDKVPYSSVLIDIDLHIQRKRNLSILRKLTYDIPLDVDHTPDFTGSESWAQVLPDDVVSTECDLDLQLACDSIFAQISLFSFEQFYYDLYPAILANNASDSQDVSKA